jgi:hypothetical protein
VKFKALLLVSLLSSAAFADDEVRLKNGGRATGTVDSLSDGKLLVETTYAGPLKIDGAQIASLKTAAPLKIKLVTGEILISPDVKDSQEFQLRNEAPIGTAVGGEWTLLGGVTPEYANPPVNPTLRKTDDTYSLGLGYVF